MHNLKNNRKSGCDLFLLVDVISLIQRQEMKMIVYADVVIIVNFLTDYILLYLTAVFLYLNVKFRRLVISSFVGALSALVNACFFNGNTIIRLVFGTLTLLLICRVAYGKIKKIMMNQKKQKKYFLRKSQLLVI